MSHTADIAGESQTREAERGKLGKGAAHVPPGEGDASLWVLGELLTLKVPSRRTGGAYSLFEVVTQPWSGPPPHVQHRGDEAFYVLEGEYEFLVDGNTLRAGSGSLVYVPKGALHAHRNVGEVPGRMLTTHTPGDLYEHFFENAGRPAELDPGEPPAFEERPGTEKRTVEVASEFGIEIPPPVADKAQCPPVGQDRTGSPSTRKGQPRATSASGSSPSVAEQRTLGASSVRIAALGAPSGSGQYVTPRW
jgi:mannose-6-phosphate isomerase-like protein (cupin superfamily)